MEKDLKIIANSLDIGVSTLYKWKNTREKLYNYIVENYENNSTLEKTEIEEYYNQLTEEEQEMYLAEMKARVLRRKLDAKG